MNQLDVLTVGDATIDAFLHINEANMHCKVNEEGELCFKSGEKITVDSCDFLLGGIACNVSVGIARLGLFSGLCAEIGDDEFAAKITKGLSAEHVDQSLLLKTPEAKSSFAAGVSFKNDRILFVEHVHRGHNFSFADVSPQWVYLAGLGDEWKDAYKKTLEFVALGNAKLAFALGSHQLDVLDDLIFEVLGKTDALFVNKSEAERIASSKQRLASNSIEELLKSVQSLGPKVVSITDGERGSYSIDEQGAVRSIGVFPAQLVEKTGAGDAYASGFLGAIINSKSIEEAMRWGAINAASVIEHVGAQAGLLSSQQIQQKLNQHPEFNVG